MIHETGWSREYILYNLTLDQLWAHLQAIKKRKLDEHRQRIMEGRAAMADAESLQDYLDKIDDTPPKHKSIDDLVNRFGSKQPAPKAKA